MLTNEVTDFLSLAPLSRCSRIVASLPFSSLQQLQQQVQRTQQLLSEAQRIAYDVRTIEGAFEQHYKNVPLGASQRAMVEGAEARWQNSVVAFEDALKVQAGTVANIEGSREALGSLGLRSVPAVEVEGQADHDAFDLPLAHQRAQRFEVAFAAVALEHTEWERKSRLRIRQSESDAAGSKVDAENTHGGEA